MSDDLVENEQRKDERELMRVAIFGLDVETFCKTAVGRYLIERAENDREKAMQELADANADDPSTIRELQSRIRCVDNFQKWLAEAVREGESAEEMLKQNH